MSRLSENKFLKVIFTIIRVILVIFIIGFIIAVFLQRFSDNRLSFFNYRMFTVISGSMRPQYDIGDVLISKETEPSKIKVGDAISYEGRVGDFKGKVITHEVVKIEKDENGKYIFRTKGKTNLVEDPEVYEEQVYGVVIYKCIILSLIYKIIATNVGFYLFIIVPLLYIIASEVISMLLNKEAKRRGMY